MGYRNTMFSPSDNTLEELKKDNAEMETIIEITSNLLNAHVDLIEAMTKVVPGLLDMNTEIKCIYTNILLTTELLLKTINEHSDNQNK